MKSYGGTIQMKTLWLNSGMNRGYYMYMAARRYEVSLWELKNISWVSAASMLNIFQLKKRNVISLSGHAMFCLLYINTNEIPNLVTFMVFCCERCNLLCSHSNGDLFSCEDDIVIFTCEDIIFSCKSSPGISLVFI